MPIILNARQQRMMERLESAGEIKVSEMKEWLGVTEMTIRRDLEKLEQAGTVRRTFGGAILAGKDIALQDRAGCMTDEKIRIGRRAAERIQPGDSIFIDGGTTTLQVARHLQPGMNVTVVTNGLNIAAELQEKQITTIVVGGLLVERTSTLVGPIAAGVLSQMAFHRVFLGTTGVTAAHGFSNSNMHETELKRLAIAQAAEVNVVMDATKFGLKDLFSFAALEVVTRIITDREPSPELLACLNEASVNVDVT